HRPREVAAPRSAERRGVLVSVRADTGVRRQAGMGVAKPLDGRPAHDRRGPTAGRIAGHALPQRLPRARRRPLGPAACPRTVGGRQSPPGRSSSERCRLAIAPSPAGGMLMRALSLIAGVVAGVLALGGSSMADDKKDKPAGPVVLKVVSKKDKY